MVRGDRAPCSYSDSGGMTCGARALSSSESALLDCVFLVPRVFSYHIFGHRRRLSTIFLTPLPCPSPLCCSFVHMFHFSLVCDGGRWCGLSTSTPTLLYHPSLVVISFSPWLRGWVRGTVVVGLGWGANGDGVWRQSPKAPSMNCLPTFG